MIKNTIHISLNFTNTFSYLLFILPINYLILKKGEL